MFYVKVTGLLPQNPDIVSVAADIVASVSDVICTEEQRTELVQAVISLEEVILRTEKTLAGLQIALEDATGTTAAFTTTTPTCPAQMPDSQVRGRDCSQMTKMLTNMTTSE